MFSMVMQLINGRFQDRNLNLGLWARDHAYNCPTAYLDMRFPGSTVLKNLPADAGDTQEMQVQFLGWEDTLEKERATHSSILAWKMSWQKESGSLQSIGWQRSQCVYTH